MAATIRKENKPERLQMQIIEKHFSTHVYFEYFRGE